MTLRRCAACEVSLAWAWADCRAYRRLYLDPRRYHVEEQVRQGMAPHAERFAEHCAAGESRVAVLKDLGARGRLLDIGAGTGAFVWVARRHGFAAHGLEPNVEVTRQARECGIPVRRGGWRQAGGCWDVITLHDVIEHLMNPLSCLRRLRGCLRRGGLLVVETPEWRADRPSTWRHLRPREHVCLFSEVALREALRRAGFAVEEVRRPVEGKLAVYAQVAEPIANARHREGAGGRCV